MNALAIMRQMKGHEIDLLHHKKSAPAYSRYCNKLIICPNVNDEEDFFIYKSGNDFTFSHKAHAK